MNTDKKIKTAIFAPIAIVATIFICFIFSNKKYFVAHHNDEALEEAPLMSEEEYQASEPRWFDGTFTSRIAGVDAYYTFDCDNHTVEFVYGDIYSVGEYRLLSDKDIEIYGMGGEGSMTFRLDKTMRMLIWTAPDGQHKYFRKTTLR